MLFGQVVCRAGEHWEPGAGNLLTGTNAPVLSGHDSSVGEGAQAAHFSDKFESSQAGAGHPSAPGLNTTITPAQ